MVDWMVVYWEYWKAGMWVVYLVEWWAEQMVVWRVVYWAVLMDMMLVDRMVV